MFGFAHQASSPALTPGGPVQDEPCSAENLLTIIILAGSHSGVSPGQDAVGPSSPDARPEYVVVR